MTILEDLGGQGLRLVVCGMAAGDRSAAMGAYYAGLGNKFWKTLHAVGLTPTLMDPSDWRSLAAHGIGFTDLAKHHQGIDAKLPKDAFDPARVRGIIASWQPAALAFNGLAPAKKFLGRSAVSPGLQPESIGRTAIWALPSTSGLASGHWDIAHWQAMAASLPPR